MAVGRKTGGRQKGTPNKSSEDYREKIRRYAKSKNYDPVYAMIKMAISKDEDISSELKFKCHESVAKYLISPLRPVDPETGSAEDRIVIRVELSGPASD